MMGASTGTEDCQEVDKESLQRPWAGHFCGGFCSPGGSRHATNDPSVARAPCTGEVAQRQSHVQEQHKVRAFGSCWPRRPMMSAWEAGPGGPDRGGRGPGGAAASRAETESWEETASREEGKLYDGHACGGHAFLKLSSALVFQQPLSLCKSLFF